MNKVTRVFAPVVSAALMALSAPALAADAISDAVASSHRSADAKVRDEYRNPQQTLRFFGIKPEMTVVEILPGGGWYTDILAEVISDEGKLYAAHFNVKDDSPSYYPRLLNEFKDKVANHPPYSNITITAFDPLASLEIAPAGSADAVLTFRNVHNWYMAGGTEALENSFKTFYAALKPGGVLGVVEHEMPESMSDDAMKSSGYMKKSVVLDAAQSAGFELLAESDINANSMDNADHPKGVWTLPPSLSLKEVDRDKYLAIGESNRMTLKFVKPE